MLIADKTIDFSENALKILEKRYLLKNDQGQPIEKPEQMLFRVAKNIAQADLIFDPQANIEKTTQIFYEMMADLAFLPNSPTLMNAGKDLQQLSACFVLPIEDNLENIFETIKHAALIHKSGGGTGFSFSRLRPKNDSVATTHGVSSGPVSFMNVFDCATEAVKQGGTRRGANMAILRIDHPDILEFIHCKQHNDRLNNFNISVALTEVFMEAVENNQDYPLINPRNHEIVQYLNARLVFDQLVEMAWKNGDPGIVFLDRINRDNPTPHIGEIESTNPCGEQPLLPYESCNLGSINLTKIIENGEINYPKFAQIIHHAVHFLDNVIEINHFPLPQIKTMTQANRKIGLGIMGFADMLLMLDIPYNSEKGLETAEQIMGFLQTESKKASQYLAEQRGVFPNFEGSICDFKLRNATTTTLAPTGTISMITGCSSGIEPLFALCYVKNVMDNTELLEINPLFAKIAKKAGFFTENLMHEVAKTGSLKHLENVPDKYKKLFVTAHDISPEWHIKIQAAFQRHTDNAVSKTVNFPHEATQADVATVFKMAYQLGCKGVTIYRDGSKDTQVLYAGKTIEKNDKKQSIAHNLLPRSRPETTHGKTYKIGTGCGSLYVTINSDEFGACEVFSQMGKSGGCAASQSESVARLISLALRAGIAPYAIQEQLAGIRCPLPAWQKNGMVLSCADGIAKILKKYLDDHGHDAPESNNTRGEIVGMCPDCGHVMEFMEGCSICKSCGFSKCG